VHCIFELAEVFLVDVSDLSLLLVTDIIRMYRL